MEQRIGNILCANRTATDNHSARTMPQWVFLNLGLKSKHYLASVFRESKQSSLFFVSEVAKQHNEAFQSDNSEYLRVRTEVFKWLIRLKNAIGTFAIFPIMVICCSNSPISQISNRKMLTEISYHIPRSFHDATCFVRGLSTLMNDDRVQVHNLYLPAAVLHNSANTKVQVR